MVLVNKMVFFECFKAHVVFYDTHASPMLWNRVHKNEALRHCNFKHKVKNNSGNCFCAKSSVISLVFMNLVPLFYVCLPFMKKAYPGTE